MKRIARASSSCYSYGNQNQEDRLGSLPDALLICILSYVDTKLAVQSSVLAKRWVNLWTLLPVLNFDYSLFVEDQEYTLDKLVYKYNFDSFIDKVLAYRNVSIKLDSINIKVTDHKTMARVFRYVLLHGVPNLSIDTSENLSKHHPILCDSSSDLLMSLTLKGMLNFGKFLNFVGLVSLRLERVKIVESEPFSCFPNLEKLFLVNCKLLSDLDVLEVIGFRLKRLTISSCFHHPNLYKKLVLLTPKLLFLELDGLVPMPFEAFEIPLLDIVYMDCYSNDHIDNHEHKINLFNIFRCLKKAKRVHLSPSTVQLLNICHDMLDEEPCPFGNLEYLNLIPPPNKPKIQVFESVAAFLLKDCPKAVVEAIHSNKR